MPLPFAVLLERELDSDGFVGEELAIHRLDRRVGRLEVVVRNETVAFGLARRRVACDLEKRITSVVPESASVTWPLKAYFKLTHLGLLRDNTERRKRVVKHALVDNGIEIADEQVGPDVELLPVVRRLGMGDNTNLWSENLFSSYL